MTREVHWRSLPRAAQQLAWDLHAKLQPRLCRTARQNGGWGHHLTAANASAIAFINPAAFTVPSTYQIGNIARVGADNLFSPGVSNINGSFRKQRFHFGANTSLSFKPMFSTSSTRSSSAALELLCPR